MLSKKFSSQLALNEAPSFMEEEATLILDLETK